MVSKYRHYVVLFRHKARVWRTDRQNYDPQDRAIAASRGWNGKVSAYSDTKFHSVFNELRDVDTDGALCGNPFGLRTARSAVDPRYSLQTWHYDNQQHM